MQSKEIEDGIYLGKLLQDIRIIDISNDIDLTRRNKAIETLLNILKENRNLKAQIHYCLIRNYNPETKKE